MLSKRLMVLILAAFGVTACQTADQKQAAGTLLGAGLGALAGTQLGKGKGQLATTAVGTFLGAWLGGEVGKSLDAADRLAARDTTNLALEKNRTGVTSTWSNPDSGHSGTVTPTHTYQTSGGTYCREFETTITVGGQQQSAYGTACREPDGAWRIRG